MLFGAVLLSLALSLFAYNQRQASEAGKASAELMPQLMEQINAHEQTREDSEPEAQPVGTPIEHLDPSVFQMAETVIGGHAYIGYLSIPKLELELPIMSDWDFMKLHTAPCRYHGSLRGEDLVIMAHNYDYHFGNLSKLEAGDSVIFTDVEGVSTAYTVVAQDILDSFAVEEMTAGEYDLTLFTCTYGGQSRVTVYCDFA